MKYTNVIVALDGSVWSKWAEDWAVQVCRKTGATLHGLHVYAAKLHRARFEQMEPGLPAEFQSEERLGELRDTHDALITDGLKLISDSYLRGLQEKALRTGLRFVPVLPEGRNYVEILRYSEKANADLIVLGAKGLGAVDLVPLGSVAERVLAAASCDVLIVRSAIPTSSGAVLAGVDGSEHGYGAAHVAAAWSEFLGAPLRLAAVYDPQFHTGVFRTIAEVLPEEVSEKFDFKSQERLHDQIIDKGLAHLYRSYLERAANSLHDGISADTTLLEGKPFQALIDQALPGRVSLMVVGRHGAHREAIATIGSNALSIARHAPVSVLVTMAQRKLDSSTSGSETSTPEQQISWAPEARERLKRVPLFARGMAKKAIENYAKEHGYNRVTLEVYLQAKKHFGM